MGFRKLLLFKLKVMCSRFDYRRFSGRLLQEAAKVIIAIISATIIAIVVAIYMLHNHGVGSINELPVYRFYIDTSAPLSEAVAVDVSRQALAKAGIATDRAHPVPYWNDKSLSGERLFARNRKNPGRGYVLWKIGGSANSWDYCVLLERHGESIECKVLSSEVIRRAV